MKNLAKLMMAVGVFALAARPVAAVVQTGMTREDLEAELGPPQGAMTVKGQLHLFYDGGVIQLVSNRVVAIDKGFAKRTEERQRERAFEAEQTAKGLVKYDGEWITKEEAAQRQADKEAAQSMAQARAQARVPAPSTSYEGGERVREVREGGKRLELSSIIVPGKITVVDFFADWCGPCRAMAPKLAELARNDPDVYLCKVDIVNWQSAIAAQYDLHSIPSVRVYNRNGGMVGSPTHDISKVIDAVQRAK